MSAQTCYPPGLCRRVPVQEAPGGPPVKAQVVLNGNDRDLE